MRLSILRTPQRRFAVLAAGVLALGAGIYLSTRPQAVAELKTAKVERGALVSVATASGTLNAVTSVQVGSQVSGQIRDVLVDFNSVVKKNQLIARIDPETFEYRVRQSEADVDAARAAVLVQEANVMARRTDIGRAEVNLAEAKRDLARKEELVARKFISPSERDKAEAVARAQEEDVKTLRAQLAVAEAQVQNAKATVKQREAALAQARVDLDRTQIRSPIDGIVIKRTIEPGQTVAASLQAPELFVIAKNLTDMQVDTAIDEAEIGRIKPGQAATFTVDAFPGRSFSGSVLQVRKAAQNVSNVITYTAVVSARNDDLALLPGMTANVRIVTDRRESVLKVPNAALRFKPAGFEDKAGGGAAGGGGSGDGKAAAPAGGSPGDRMKAYRERLERELSLDNVQKTRLDAAYAAVRDKFMALRDLPDAERPKAAERVRAELRERIAEFLNKEQLEKFAAINAEVSGRASTSGRGRVFVFDAARQPKPLNVRTGLSDGSQTEVAPETEGGLKEGDEVIIGSAAPAVSARPSGGPRGF